jgi:hypothetical protein
MNAESIMDCERKNVEKLKRFQLPNYFKKIGLALLLFSLLAAFLNKYLFEQEELRIVFRYSMLLGLLFISVSKEKLEDELVRQLRLQSYSLAFVLGVLYSIATPFIGYGIDRLLGSEEAVVKELGDFTVLWMLLIFQVVYFETLKKMHK